MSPFRSVPLALCAAAALCTSPPASAQTIVNIDARNNCDLTGAAGVDVPMPAGTYLMRPVVGAFTAWNAWGVVSGCDGSGQCSAGWFIAWHVMHENGDDQPFPDPFQGIWVTPELAFIHNSTPQVLIVPVAETLTFAIIDTPCSDNLGGVSLEITHCNADFNNDGTVNSTDVSDFINAWFDNTANGCG